MNRRSQTQHNLPALPGPFTAAGKGTQRPTRSSAKCWVLISGREELTVCIIPGVFWVFFFYLGTFKKFFSSSSFSIAYNHNPSSVNTINTKIWDTRRKAGDFWLWNELKIMGKSRPQKFQAQLFYNLTCCCNSEIIILTFEVIAISSLGIMAVAAMCCSSSYSLNALPHNFLFLCTKSAWLS